MKYILALGLAFALTAHASAQTPAVDSTTDIATNTAVLRALDKVAARVQTFNVPVGQPVSFGRLEILVKSCFTRPPEETPENSALLFITKLNAKGQKTTVFDGWMFASSPGLSAMDDPVYDIWVIECANKAASNSR
jgi:hypothetical protein